MGDKITGELNNTAPMTLPGVHNQGATVESDDDTSDARHAGTGSIDVAKFPNQTLSIPDQLEAAKARAKTSPKGGDATAQTYRAEVPFSSSKLELGSASSAGGAGASITTAGNVFIGATGKLGMQSLAAFTGQTKATMGLYAKAGITAHSQDKFEIYSGGGVAPGKCGSGGPAGSDGTTKPAEKAEKWTSVGCNALGVFKAANDLYNVTKNFKAGTDLVSDIKMISDGFSGLKAATDMAGKGYAAVAGAMADSKEEKDALKKNSKEFDKASAEINAGSAYVGLLSSAASIAAGEPGDALSSLLGAVSSRVSAESSYSGATDGTSALNREGPVPGSKGAAGSVPGAPAPAAGGPLDIEKRAAAKIHQCSNIKVTGNAPEGVDFKVGGAFVVNAIASVDFATTNWGAFALVLFKVRAVALIDVKCRKFEMKALGRGLVKTPHTTVVASKLSTLDGVTEVTKTLTVLKHSSLHDELHVDKEKDSFAKGNLTVKKDTTDKDDAKFYKTCKFEGHMKVKASMISKSKLKAASEGKLG